MKTITIKSEFASASTFDVFGLELITACGVVPVYCLYVKRTRAEKMANYYQTHGWLNTTDNIRYKVYQVNLVEKTVYL